MWNVDDKKLESPIQMRRDEGIRAIAGRSDGGGVGVLMVLMAEGGWWMV